MSKNWFVWLGFVVALVVVLSACSATGVSSEQTSAVQTSLAGGNGNVAQMTLETRLAVGILKLEGSQWAITAEQARTLLPLWKAVKTLSGSDTASADEIQALYEQIQEALTAEQIQQIQAMSLTQDDIRALMEQYGISFNAPMGGDGTLSQEQIATRVAQRAQSGGGFPGGGVPPEGGFGGAGAPPGMMGEFGGQVTPDPTRMAQRRGLGMNRLFLDPLIQLLETRSAKG
ncbi:hypothetical protein [Bellilinea sp.]|uniref:hypothetical protein n=1 Tax=Bellilinea sp. TaxID=2838785 RepID=UPI0021DEBFA1|nr:hypothetical protein [Bellilinea sp.]GIV64835.1 MAG: hypothetical protein KatS3mg046_095 [Bellilinea sp.]